VVSDQLPSLVILVKNLVASDLVVGKQDGAEHPVPILIQVLTTNDSYRRIAGVAFMPICVGSKVHTRIVAVTGCFVNRNLSGMPPRDPQRAQERKQKLAAASDSQKVAMKTSRAHGAVGPRALVPPIVRQFALKNHSILDYGAGELAEHAKALRDEGFNVTAHDHWGKEGIHDPTALQRKYDIVYASNMLNTQDNRRRLHDALNDIHKSVKSNGMAIVNLPSGPRKGAYAGLAHMDANKLVEGLLRQRFRDVHHIAGGNAGPVWLCKTPILR
jgi:hypothetical protein